MGQYKKVDKKYLFNYSDLTEIEKETIKGIYRDFGKGIGIDEWIRKNRRRLANWVMRNNKKR